MKRFTSGEVPPSLLSTSDLNTIFEKIYTLHTVDSDAEITLEANPDDLTHKKLIELKATPINRLSIGIQSFFEDDLKFMNRAHNAKEAKACIENAQSHGFENLTIDLIYGTPTMNDDQWNSNIQKAIDFKIPHLSCYCLTVEPKTALDHFVKTKKAPPVDQEQASQQFEKLIKKTSENNYIHYEISNFALGNWYSKHNSAYWKGNPIWVLDRQLILLTDKIDNGTWLTIKNTFEHFTKMKSLLKKRF